MKSIKSLKNIKGKRIIFRADFNVPIRKGKVEDDFRIKKTLKSIKYLLKKGAKILIITHLGKDGSQSITPVKKRFFELSRIPENRVTFFDNVRKFKGEEKNDQRFSKRLASLGDIFVNDAFSVSHRVHASIVGIPKYLPSYAGFQLEDEIRNLSKALKNSPRPFLFILGGAKFENKMPLVWRYIKLADHVFVGGALLNNFLKIMGYEIGKSLFDEKDLGLRKILNNKKLILPVDVVVKHGFKLMTKNINQIRKNDTTLDIGPKSIKKIEPFIKNAKLIVWGGPLGVYEEKGGDVATKKILKMVAKSKAESIIGGGNTVVLISRLKMEKNFTFVSTGGGAALEFLSKGTLPGIKALR